MEIGLNPEVTRHLMRDPSTWSDDERTRVAQYLNFIDAVDASFESYRKHARQQDSGNASEAEVTQAKAAWEQNKRDAKAMREALGRLADVMADLNAGTKSGRAGLRERLAEYNERHEDAQTEIQKETQETVALPESPSAYETVPMLPESPAAFDYALEQADVVVPGPEVPAPPVQTRADIALLDAELQKATRKTPEVEPKPSIFRWMRESRIARSVYALGAIFGISKAAVAGIEDLRSDQERRDFAHERMNEIVTQSAFGMAEQYGVISLDNLPSPDDELTFPDGETLTRNELTGKMDVAYTKLMKEKGGPVLTMGEQCATTLPDGTNGFDALKCNAIYGDQVRLSEPMQKLLAAAHGYSVDELTVHGKIIRNSVIQDPGSIIIGSGVKTMAYFEYGSVSESYKSERTELYEQYYDDASTIAFEAIRTLDIDPGDTEAIRAVQNVIKAEIHLSNESLVVAGDIQNITNDYSAAMLMTGELNGEHFTPHIDRLHDALDDADLAWKTLSALESDTSGTMHTLTAGMRDVHQAKTDSLLRAGRDAGSHPEFFLEQLNKLDPGAKQNTRS